MHSCSRLRTRGFPLWLIGLAVAVPLAFGLLECGERKVKTVYLVQHGLEAKEGHWPWHTAIYHREGNEFSYVCGGSIIDRNTILTAAHCVMTDHGPIELDRLSVQVGRNRLSVASERSQEHQALELILHPGFSVNSVTDDIALIKLATDVTLTNYIQPVCLWNQDEKLELIVGRNGTIVGFGLTENDRVSDYLRQAVIGVVDTWTCLTSDREVYGPTLTSGMYCARGKTGVSACNGDSGGGMFFEFDGTWYVRGIVSFMPLRDQTGLCDGTKYTVFTDVAKYRDWIAQFVNETQATERRDPLSVNNSAKLRLLNFNACGIAPAAVSEPNGTFMAYPWLGLMLVQPPGQRPQGLCQVTLISEWYVVGPAHCFANDGMERMVRLGEYDTATEPDCIDRNGSQLCAPSTQTLPIHKIILRPDYNALSITDDLALVQLGQPADLTVPNVKPICLPVTRELRSYKPRNFVVSSFLQGPQTTLYRTEPIYLNSVNCQERYKAIGHPLRKSNMQICALHAPSSSSSPQNDTSVEEPCQKMLSGAPLQVRQELGRRERHFLHGLLSFGPRDCDSTVPEIYTNVANYLDWILYNMVPLEVDKPNRPDRVVFPDD
ncbi:prostasin-like [Anopheles albimanus]|uniref:Peptidase S1 domain-containing protein n=1 Tax=Anopheles albimanus TaxID=7167 RepID=A0A182F6E7_ANOAL|nr:prostasin-like [Anopheles albimanus]